MEPISSATGKTVTEMERGRLDRALEPGIRTDDNVDESPRTTPPPNPRYTQPKEQSLKIQDNIFREGKGTFLE